MRRIILAILLLANSISYSQENDAGILATAMPWLDVNTNARTGALGDIGVVSSDFYRDGVYSQNPALLSMQGKYAGAGFSYMPWMTSMANGYSYTEMNAFSSISNNGSLAYRFQRFSSGDIYFTDNLGNLVSGNPVNFYHQLSYSHSFNNLSLGTGFKYIYSEWRETNPNISARNVAIDFGIIYKSSFDISKKSMIKYKAGGAIINFGPRVKYSNNDIYKQFIPTSLGLGAIIGPDFYLSDRMRLTMEVAYQVNKYLIPTPPVYARDNLTNAPVISEEGNYVISKGMDPDISPFRALYQSFYDAPGGFSEEIQELQHRLGAEVRLNFERSLYFAARIGRFREHELEGNRKYNTWGLGIGFYGFALDYKRIVTRNEYLDNTWALSMGFRTNFDQLFRF